MAYYTLDVRPTMIRPSRLGILAILVGTCTTASLWAQEVMPGASRFDWQSVVVMIIPDSLSGVSLEVKPRSRHDQTGFGAHFEPAETKKWEAASDSVVRAEDPPASDTSKALQGPILQDRNRFRMAVGRVRRAGAWSPQVRWYLEENEQPAPLIVDMSLSQAHDLLVGFDLAAGVSGLDTSYHPCGHSDEMAPAEDSVRHPEVIEARTPVYPNDLARAGVEGEVLVKFVVTANGDTDPASIVVVWASAHAFGESAREAVSLTHFRPATQRGVRISCLVQQSMKYKMRNGP